MSVMARLKAAGVECYPRAEWGSVRPAAYAKRRSTHPMPPGPAPYHYLHITVTPDTDTVLQGKSGARKVESYGLSTPPMVSYQALVTNEGKWFEGQNYGVKGTHTVNDKNVPGFPRDLNKYGYAVAIMQNVGDAVTDIQVRVIAMTFAAAELDGYVKRGAPIYPHRKFDWKECPGDKAVARLSEITRLKNQYVARGLPKAGTPKPPASPEDEMTPAQMTELKNFIEARLQAYTAFVVLNREQTTERDLDALKAQMAEFDLQLDRIEDDTDDDAAPAATKET